MVFPPHFNVDTLDEFLPRPPAGDPSAGSKSWSVAISGQDGSGKSVLALHLASAYWFEAWREVKRRKDDPLVLPVCIYVSTDLSYEQAEGAWKTFGLHRPGQRLTTLREAYGIGGETYAPPEKDLELQLKKVLPDEEEPLKKMMSTATGDDEERRVVWFVDLEEKSAGDDWGFLNRMLGMLPSPPKDLPHLLVIDAVEGLEVLAGRRDAFGSLRSRRSQIAQLVRAARARTPGQDTHKAHMTFVIEEARPHRKLPEQFVTDLVIRLRRRVDGDYAIRTLEIEKCRETAHVRGEHMLTIRSGRGAWTGESAHQDEPPVTLLAATGTGGAGPIKPLAHLHIQRSLHAWAADIRATRAQMPEFDNAPPRFDIAMLDRMVGANTPVRGQSLKGSVTFLMGDAGTYKSRLARRFLASALGDSFGDPLLKDGKPGIVVMFTTGLLDDKRLLEKLKQQGVVDVDVDQSKIKESVLCRRLAVRHDSSASLLSTIEAYVREARRRLMRRLRKRSLAKIRGCFKKREYATAHNLDRLENLKPDRRGNNSFEEAVAFRAELSAHIRVVFDDLTLYLGAHPNIRTDPLFLQSLVFLLKHLQVTALVVSTQPGQPILAPGLRSLAAGAESHGAEGAAAALRQFDERQIVTWGVPFYGQTKVALTVLNPHREDSFGVCEIQPLDKDAGEAVGAGPQLELYSGLEEGHPHRIPLRVRLFCRTEDTSKENTGRYAQAVHKILAQVFPGRGAEVHPGRDDVVEFESLASYEDFSSFADWLDDAHLDHTLVFQIDEFWGRDQEPKALMELDQYWGDTMSNNPAVKDEYGAYMPFKDPQGDSLGRNCLQITERPGYPKTPEVAERNHFFIGAVPRGEKVFRVPYLWDFGFLLARRDAWWTHRNEFIPKTIEAEQLRVGDIWNSLCIKSDVDRMEVQAGPAVQAPISWMQFFDACEIVGQRSSMLPFDVDTVTSQSLLSLLLEIWASASEMMQDTPALAHSWGRRIVLTRGISLRQLIFDELPSLYVAMVELAWACRHLQPKGRVMTSAPRPSQGPPAAERHWYSTATVAIERSAHALSVLRLPGYFSVRGDWDLAIAAGSRSKLLGYRVMDVLNDRSLGLLRMHDGVGLPCRECLPDDQLGNAFTALYRTHRDTERRRAIQYRELCQLAPDNFDPANTNDGFWCLRRSQIKGYQRDTFFLRRFLGRLFEEVDDWLIQPHLRWTLYPALRDTPRGHEGIEVFEGKLGEDVLRFRKFCQIADVLIAALGGQK